MPPPASGKNAVAGADRAARPLDRRGGEVAAALVVHPARAADAAGRQATPPGSAIRSTRFVLARLEREGLAPSPEADRDDADPPRDARPDRPAADAGRGRRVSGRHRRPTPTSKLVDRLLASPRYGERMAARWLDAARYADTNGYQTDGARIMWRWRDWVIDAFNAQHAVRPVHRSSRLAGDLLPGATLDQQIATGFNRNHRGNAEGGIIPEEYAVEYVVDRVDTTATVWLGLTLGCARCHDHKYDPLTQTEFYQLFAFFNNVPEKGRAIKVGNSPPLIKAPTPRPAAATARHRPRNWPPPKRDLPTLQAAIGRRRRRDWAAQLAAERSDRLAAGRTAWWRTFRSTTACRRARRRPRRRAGRRDRLRGRRRSARRPRFDGTSVARRRRRRPTSASSTSFTLAAWIRPRRRRAARSLSRMADRPDADGYSLQLADGKLQVNLVKRWLDDALRVETERAAGRRPLAARGRHLRRLARGRRRARSTSTASRRSSRSCSTS